MKTVCDALGTVCFQGGMSDSLIVFTASESLHSRTLNQSLSHSGQVWKLLHFVNED